MGLWGLLERILSENSHCSVLLYNIHCIFSRSQLAKMPSEQKSAVMEPNVKTEFICPDEMQLLLQALRWYAQDSEGRKNAGRLTWLREKVVRAKLHGHHLIPLATD